MIARQECFQESFCAHDDLDLVRRVQIFLHSKQVRSLRGVSVEADRGTVVLRGEVNSFYEKQLCISCAKRVAGVLELIDEIQVPQMTTVSA